MRFRQGLLNSVNNRVCNMVMGTAGFNRVYSRIAQTFVNIPA